MVVKDNEKLQGNKRSAYNQKFLNIPYVNTEI